jgi:acyl-CoA thioesterase II
MGDLDRDTALQGDDGCYTAVLSRDWEIWGPNGGYIAAIMLRAAGTASSFPVPASLAVHYLARASFDEVQLTVRSLRRTRRAEAFAVSMTQGDRAVAETMAWFVDRDLQGLEHDVTQMPSVPPPETVPTMAERNAEAGLESPFKFWDNLDNRMLDWRSEWPPAGPLPPTSDSWFRFLPTATFGDPLVDAARLVIVLDTMGWPAATRHHAWEWPVGAAPAWVAPSLDLFVRFHQPAPESEFVFAHVEAPIAAGPLITTEGRVWSQDGRLLASGASQLLSTPVPPA